MKANVIIVSVEKSNKSENNVWAVAITGEEQKQAYCKSAYKAMRFAFLLKKQTGFYIEDDSLKMLSEQIAEQKAKEAEGAAAQKLLEEVAQQFAESHSVDAVLAEPEAEQPKKKARKSRTKKVQAEPALAQAAEAAGLIAFM
jgi:phage terminase large subunit-like protein